MKLEQLWICQRIRELMDEVTDPTVRCRCGRSIVLSEAKADGWVDIKVPQARGVIVQGTCWRCHREQRTQE